MSRPVIDPALLEHVYLQRMTMCDKERALHPERSFMELMCGKDRREEWARSRSLLAFESWDKKDEDGILGAAFRVLSSLSEDGKGYRGLLYYEPMLRHSGGRIAEALYELFREGRDAEAFDSLMLVMHKIRMSVRASAARVSMPAYFFFLKDPGTYVPYGEFMFESCLAALDVRKPFDESWKGYSDYLRMIGQIRSFLRQRIGEDVSLMQAYGFFRGAWRPRRDTPEWTGGEDAFAARRGPAIQVSSPGE